jgi:hypothetical protein
MHRAILFHCALIVVGVLLWTGNSPAQAVKLDPKQKITPQQATAVAAVTVDTKSFGGKLSLKEYLALLSEYAAAKGHKLPIYLDEASFQGDPDAAPIGTAIVNFPVATVKSATITQMLQFAATQVPTKNAVAIFKDGYFVITNSGKKVPNPNGA